MVNFKEKYTNEKDSEPDKIKITNETYAILELLDDIKFKIGKSK
jgi:hypothetical protein